jgi:CheY-like chemotaxis protein
LILVVDDDPAFLERARKILNHQRQVFLASSSKKAFTLAQDLGFSVVLVDLDLRGDDGLALIRRIHENLPGLPIIAISEKPQVPVLDQIRELGVAEVLHKPITPEWKPVVERVRAMRARAW